jgi:uroporphyrinogen-III synthase
VSVRVLVTRPEGSWPALTARFRETPIVLQMTETTAQVDPIDPRPADEALDRLDRYDWLVVTSPRGVLALTHRLASRGVTGLPPGLRVAVIGPATARALRELGARVELVADEETSGGLAASLLPRLERSASVLIVRPEGVEGTLAASLRAAGVSAREAALYRTVPSERVAELAEAAIAGSFAAVVFTAPSAATLWLASVGGRHEALFRALTPIARVAIGPTTAGALASIGLPASAVAAKPQEDAVGDAIVHVLRAADLLP